jgi:anti-sigma factor RsiW
MHEYLDNDISPEHEKELKAHLQECTECQIHFHQLEKTIALVKGQSIIKAPSDFTAKVMANLPKEKKKVGVQRWFRHHPLLTAASLFMVLMVGSLMSTWNGEKNLSVTKQPNLVVQNDTVIVPAGEVVKGDVVVQNGTLRIEGRVDGDVTVINGKQYMASAGEVTGEIKEVNAVFEWIWYHMKNTAVEVVNLFEDNEKENEQSLEVAVFPRHEEKLDFKLM